LNFAATSFSRDFTDPDIHFDLIFGVFSSRVTSGAIIYLLVRELFALISNHSKKENQEIDSRSLIWTKRKVK